MDYETCASIEMEYKTDCISGSIFLSHQEYSWNFYKEKSHYILFHIVSENDVANWFDYLKMQMTRGKIFSFIEHKWITKSGYIIID